MQTRRSLRLKGYDYRQNGAYFVTICSYRHAELFGAIVGKTMRLNAIGRIVSEEWRRTADLRNNVEMDRYVIMPNHPHGIVLLLGEEAVESPVRAAADSPERKGDYLLAGSLGSIIGRFKGRVTRRVRDMPHCQQLQVWQRNYHDHIIRNDKSLRDIQDYIAVNPSRWTEDRYYAVDRAMN